MKIVDRRVSLVEKPVESPIEEVKNGAKSAVGRRGPSVLADRVTLSGGGEVSQTATEILDERRKKIDEIQSLFRSGGAKAYFQARPESAVGITTGISSEVALMQEIVGKAK